MQICFLSFWGCFPWHVINQNGVTVDHKYVSGGMTEVQYFLGGLEFSWTCWILSSVSSGCNIAKSMIRQSSYMKDALFVWIVDCETSIHTLKEKLVKALILISSRVWQMLYNICDASRINLGLLVLCSSRKGGWSLMHLDIAWGRLS
jgi:hypothetical protein